MPVETKQIKIVEIADNRVLSGLKAYEREVDMTQYQQLLEDPGQVDSPLLNCLGFPVILVSTSPRQECIPRVSSTMSAAEGWCRLQLKPP